jgi:ankyrin repeat protein
VYRFYHFPSFSPFTEKKNGRRKMQGVTRFSTTAARTRNNLKRENSFVFKHVSNIKELLVPIVKNEESKMKHSMEEQILRLAKNRQYEKLIELLITESAITKQMLCIPKGSTVTEQNERKGCGCDCVLTVESPTADSNLDKNVVNDSPKWLMSHTILHEVLVYQPPFDVVDTLCSILCDQSKMTLVPFGNDILHRLPEDIENNRCQKPLHVAIRSGCDVLVIQRLMKGDFIAKPSTAIDDGGRTPLHWACANHKGTCLSLNDSHGEARGFVTPFRKGHDKKRIQNMIQIVHVLVNESPRAVCTYDHNNETPLDIARRLRAHPEIILELLNASHHLNSVQVEDTEDKTKDTLTTTGTKSKETNVVPSPRTTGVLRRVRSERSMKQSAMCDTKLTKSFRTLGALTEQSQSHDLLSPIDLVIECRTRSRRTRTVVIEDVSSVESNDFGYLDCMRFM